MTQQHSEIGFKSVQLFKDQTLGIGAYGKVCRAKCDNLDCAAKLLHETLFDTNAEQLVARTNKEHRLPIRRFEKECQFLNMIKHPNIIQYLGMFQDPSSGLAVLLMELMECSLTSYLETSSNVETGMPFHIQINVCHDITLALSFLHSNGIIHRDLSGNNVLLSGQPNVRAKVTDFGMASLCDQLSPRQSYLTYTMCPGTDAYMPPEAVKDNSIYTETIDCFSFGVIVIQILSKKFPKPSDRMKKIEINSPGMSNVIAYVPVSEHERRQEHINKVDPENPLLQVALDCIKDNDTDRPTAHWLCERMVDLKDTAKYRESVANSTVQRECLRTSSDGNDRMGMQTRELQEQLQNQRQQIQDLIQTRQAQEERFSRQIAQKNEMIQQQRQITIQMDALLEQKEAAIAHGQRDIQLLRNQLQNVSLDKEHLEQEIHTLNVQHTQEIQGLQYEIQCQAEHFKKEIEQRDQVIKDQQESLNQKEVALVQKEQTLIQREEAIDAKQQEIQLLKQQLDQEKTQRMKLEGKMFKLEQEVCRKQSTSHPQVVYPAPAPSVTSTQRVSKSEQSFLLRWDVRRNMPCPMIRGCDAVVKGSIVYFMVAGSSRVYNFSTPDNTCFSLPDCPVSSCSLAIINDQLTAVGGSLQDCNRRVKCYSNKLFSFKDTGVWTEDEFPHMPTKRDSTLSVNIGTALVVAGGRTTGGAILKTVEVLCTQTLQWTTVPSLPVPLQNASGAVCGGEVYVLGGVSKDFFENKAVFTCSVDSLVKLCEPKSLGARLMNSLTSTNLWRRLADVPVTKSTCTSLCGHLLAVGGEDSRYSPTEIIHMYDSMLNSWRVVSQMSVARSNCLVASLRGNRLMVGGRAGVGRNNSVEIASVIV